MSDTPKTLNELIEYMNESPAVFGWKSRYEALIDFAEKLEAENAEMKKLVEQAKSQSIKRASDF